MLVEDIVDTGLTLAYLLGQLGGAGPRRSTACTLLDRPSRRIVPQDAALPGLELDDEFVLGYGLDMRGPVPQPRRDRGGGDRRGAGRSRLLVAELYPGHAGAP